MKQPEKLKRAGVVISLLFVCSSAFAQTPQDRFVAVNGLRLHYLDWGSETKPPLILLHGIGRVAHTFDHVAPHFSKRQAAIGHSADPEPFFFKVITEQFHDVPLVLND